MPTIPVQSKLISTDVPVVSTNPLHQAGVLGTAIENAGSDVMRQGFNLIEKMKDAEAVTASSSAHAQDTIDSQRAYSDFKSRSIDGNAYDESGNPVLAADGSHMSISEQYRNWADERYKSNQTAMPSKLAQQKYQQMGLSFFTGEMLKMGHDENTLRVDSTIQSGKAMVQGFADNQTSTPDLDTLHQQMNTHAAAIMENPLIEYPKKLQLIREANNQLAESMFKGAYNQVLAGTRDGMSAFDRNAHVDQWRQVLNGDNGEGSGPDALSKARAANGLPTAYNSLHPDTKASIDRQFIELKKTASALDLSEFHKSMTDDIAALQLGHPERVNFGARMARIDQLAANERISPSTAADYKASLVAAKSVGSLNSPAFLLAPESAQRAMIESQAKSVVETARSAGGDASAGSKAEQEYRRQALEVVKKSQSGKQDDFPAYAEMVDKSLAGQMAQLDFTNPQSLQDKGSVIQSAIEKTQTYYGREFAGDVPVASKDRAYQISQALKNPMMSVEQKADALKSLRQSYGPYFPKLMSQMVEQDKLPASWKMAGFVGDNSAQDFISAVGGKVDVEKTFAAVGSPNGVTKDSITKEVSKNTGPWISTMLSQSPGDPNARQQAEDIQAAVTSHAMSLYAEGGGRISQGDAAKRAFQNIIGQSSSVETYKSGWFGRSYSYMIPSTVGNRTIGESDKDQIRQFVSTNNTGEGLKSLGAVGTKEQLDQIAQSGRFSLAKNMQGYNFIYTDQKNGRPAIVGVKDVQGKVSPLFVPLERMMAPTGVAPAKSKVFGQVGGP